MMVVTDHDVTVVTDETVITDVSVIVVTDWTVVTTSYEKRDHLFW